MSAAVEKMGLAVVDKVLAFGYKAGEKTNMLSCWEDPHTAGVVVCSRENPPAVSELV